MPDISNQISLHSLSFIGKFLQAGKVKSLFFTAASALINGALSTKPGESSLALVLNCLEWSDHDCPPQNHGPFTFNCTEGSQLNHFFWDNRST